MPSLGGSAARPGWGAPRLILSAVLWILATALCLFLDRPVARYIASHPLLNKHSPLAFILKIPGNFWFSVLVALALLAWNQRNSKAAAGFVLLSGVVAGLFYSLVKWAAGRHRPMPRIDPFAFHLFENGFRGLYSNNNMGFPSGHTCLAFATATAMAISVPRGRGFYFAGAALVAVERVLENAHYVSDVVAGAGLGVLSALVVFWSFRSRYETL